LPDIYIILLFLLSLTTSVLIAQVRIRDTVQINPKTPVQKHLKTMDDNRALLVITPAGPWPGSSQGIMTTRQGVRVDVTVGIGAPSPPWAAGYEVYIGDQLSQRVTKDCNGNLSIIPGGSSSFTDVISCGPVY
jgi:hypothetical protein